MRRVAILRPPLLISCPILSLSSTAIWLGGWLANSGIRGTDPRGVAGSCAASGSYGFQVRVLVAGERMVPGFGALPVKIHLSYDDGEPGCEVCRERKSATLRFLSSWSG
jgi:hypothetical protein